MDIIIAYSISRHKFVLKYNNTYVENVYREPLHFLPVLLEFYSISHRS